MDTKLLMQIWQFLAGLLSKQKLGEMGATPEELKLAPTVAIQFGGSDRVAEEERRTRERIVAFARCQLGEPYAFGAEGPADKDLDRWDCSELIEHAYANAGMKMPDGSAYQRSYCQRVPEPTCGDIGYFGPNADGVGHVVLYAGDGVVIEARGCRVAGEQKGVVKTTPRYQIEEHPRFEGWYRHPDFSRSKEERV